MSSVLIVDDNPADRALFRRVLGRDGFMVHEVATGGEALGKAREVRPHIVILDVNLPDTDGYAVCRALRADPHCAGIPILMLTILGNESDVLAGLEAGADDYVAKGSASEIVLARVKRLVRYRQMATTAVLNEQLVQVGRLLAGIIHEIRAPLSVIRGNAELIRLQEGLREDLEPWIEPILRNAQVLQARLEHLMAAVRGGPSVPKAMDVSALVREAANLFIKGTDPRGPKIAITTEIDDALPEVRADAGRLLQVVLNLLSNAHEAIQAGRGEGRIVVRVGRGHDQDRAWAKIEIADDGPGIPAAYLDRIFEPFFTTKEGGSGYGLYLAHEIIREHGGRLTARNLAEGGACVAIWLPLDEAPSGGTDGGSG